MFRWVFLLCVIPLAALGALRGVVETVSGQRIEGDVAIEPEGFAITGTNGGATSVALKDLKVFRIADTDAATNTLTILPPPPAHGLLGIYFNTIDCTGDFFKTRYDPTIDFDWGRSSPVPGINADGFSVRWVAQLLVPNSEHYTFHTVTDDGVRLWINDKLIIDGWKDEFLNLTASPVLLMAGQTNELRMEMYDARDRAVARLFWSGPTTPRGIIPSERLVPGRLSLPPIGAERPKFPAGVLLVNGSLLPGQVEAADRSSVRMTGRTAPLSVIQVARLIFRPLSAAAEAALQRGRTGVLLKSGDFAEGDLVGYKGGEIELSSVVLGARKVSAAQATAVILREPRPASARFEVKGRDGGLYRANTLRLNKNEIVISDAGLPPVTLPASELLEVQSAQKQVH